MRCAYANGVHLDLVTRDMRCLAHDEKSRHLQRQVNRLCEEIDVKLKAFLSPQCKEIGPVCGLNGASVSLVARRHGVAPNQLFTWRRLVAQGALTAAGSGEEVVPASDHRALQSQVRELHRLLGKKTLEAEI